jgi:ribosome-associated heat shock protein Hsp15
MMKGPVVADPEADESAPGRLRVDKWLWFSRIVKSRTLAAGMIAEGKVRLNRERIDKPSQQLKVGDVLTVAAGARIRIVRVTALGHRRGPPAEAQALYEDLSPPPEPRSQDPASGGSGRDPGAGRPTKRDRRQIDRLQGREE